MRPEEPPARTRAVHEITALARSVTSLLDGALADLGISFAQYRVLFVLDAVGPASGAEISRFLEVTSPTVVGLVTNLESAGLVERRKPEGRRIPFAPTRRGRRTFGEAARRVDEVEARLTAVLGGDHIEALEDLRRSLEAERS